MSRSQDRSSRGLIGEIVREREQAFHRELRVQVVMKDLRIARLEREIKGLKALIRRMSRLVPPEHRYMKVPCPICKTHYVTQVIGPRGGVKKIEPCPHCVGELAERLREMRWRAGS